jgi:hypothetical protein
MVNIDFQEEKLTSETEELLITYKFFDNKSQNPLPISHKFSELKQREHKFT